MDQVPLPTSVEDAEAVSTEAFPLPYTQMFPPPHYKIQLKNKILFLSKRLIQTPDIVVSSLDLISFSLIDGVYS